MSYFQIEVVDLVDAAGGREYLKANKEEAYTILGEAHEDLMNGLLTMYKEVGEVNWTELQDYCDNL